MEEERCNSNIKSEKCGLLVVKYKERNSKKRSAKELFSIHLCVILK